MRRLGQLLAIAVVAALASCNIVGPAAYIAMGQQKLPAQYELADVPTVVFVDDRSNKIPLNRSRVRRAIADKVSVDLMEQEVITDTISSRDAMALASSRDRDGELLSIAEIGRAVEAQQIIYVEMLSFRSAPNVYNPRASASCRIKVIDVANGARLYPPPDGEQPWKQVGVETAPLDPQQYSTPRLRRNVDEMLAALMGDQVAKLFYKHTPDELGTRLNEQ